MEKIFAKDQYPSILPNDIKKIIVSLTLDNLIKIGINDIKKIIKEFDNNVMYRTLLSENIDFWIIIWKRYVSEDINQINDNKKNKNLTINNLKQKYIEAMDFYDSYGSDTLKNVANFKDKFSDEFINEFKIRTAEYNPDVYIRYNQDFNDKIILADKFGYTKMSKILDLNLRLHSIVDFILSKNSNYTIDDVKILINNRVYNEANADVNYLAGSRKSVLYSAIYYENDELTDYLVERGADINVIPSFDDHFFPELQKYKNIKKAINLGVNVDIKNEEGTTLLRDCVIDFLLKKGDDKSTQKLILLLDAGADFNVTCDLDTNDGVINVNILYCFVEYHAFPDVKSKLISILKKHSKYPTDNIESQIENYKNLI